MNMKNLTGLIVMATVVMLSSAANATLSVKLSSGSSSMTVSDPSDTAAFLSGVTVGNWTINSTTGLGIASLSTSDMDIFHLDSVNFSSDTGGTINVMLTQTGLTKDGPFDITFGGLTNGSISFNSYVDATNTEFGLGNLVSSSGAFNNNSFSGSDGGGLSSLALSGPFSWTIVATINHTTRAATSFNYEVSIPEPNTIALLGLGMLGLGLVARKKGRDKARI